MKLHSKGFTLIELIVVMIIIAVLAVYVVMRTPSTSLYGQSYVSEQIRRDIRYTQSLAMSLNMNYSIIFSTNSYTISPNPPTGTYTITMPSGVTLSPGSITFNSMGAPAAASSVTISGTGASTTLTIAAETGFVNG